MQSIKDLKELKVGTRLQASEHGNYVYEIVEIRPTTGVGTLYKTAVVEGREPLPEPIWCTREALEGFCPFVVNPDVGDSVGVAPVVPAGDPVKGRLEAARLELAGLHSYLESVGASGSALSRVEHALGLLVEPPVEPPSEPKEPLKHWVGDCPHCGSGNLEATGEDFEAGGVTQHVACLDCSDEYREVYVLIEAVDTDSGDSTLALTYEGEVLANTQRVRSGVKELIGRMERAGLLGMAEDAEAILDLIPEVTPLI